MPDHRERTELVLDAVLAWARTQNRIRAVALVGSRARGTARPDSDIDLVLLTADPQAFHADPGWLLAIDWRPTGLRPSSWRDARYGVLWSRHVALGDGLEVEFGFAPPAWADCTPLDAGTRHVVSAGWRIVYDPDGLLAALARHVEQNEAPTIREA